MKSSQGRTAAAGQNGCLATCLGVAAGAGLEYPCGNARKKRSHRTFRPGTPDGRRHTGRKRRGDFFIRQGLPFPPDRLKLLSRRALRNHEGHLRPARARISCGAAGLSAARHGMSAEQSYRPVTRPAAVLRAMVRPGTAGKKTTQDELSLQAALCIY